MPSKNLLNLAQGCPPYILSAGSGRGFQIKEVWWWWCRWSWPPVPGWVGEDLQPSGHSCGGLWARQLDDPGHTYEMCFQPGDQLPDKQVSDRKAKKGTCSPSSKSFIDTLSPLSLLAPVIFMLKQCLKPAKSSFTAHTVSYITMTSFSNSALRATAYRRWSKFYISTQVFLAFGSQAQVHALS